MKPPPPFIPPYPPTFADHARELWRRRFLLVRLAHRDFKARYAQSLLGVGWALFQPLLTLAVMTLLFGHVIPVDTAGFPYPLFAFSAILFWTFFSTAFTNSTNSLVNQIGLVTRIYFPREILPAATIITPLADLAVSLGFLAMLFLVYTIAPPATIWAVAPLLLLLVVFTLGLGLIASAVNIYFRDVRHALPLLIQLWFFITPVAYPSSLFPPHMRLFLRLNPLSIWMDGFRGAILFGRLPSLDEWMTVAAWSAGTLAAGILVFQKLERRFGEVA